MATLSNRKDILPRLVGFAHCPNSVPTLDRVTALVEGLVMNLPTETSVQQGNRVVGEMGAVISQMQLIHRHIWFLQNALVKATDDDVRYAFDTEQYRTDPLYKAVVDLIHATISQRSC